MNTVINNFYCTRCGNKGIPIARQIGKQRKSGHLKKIFCLYCNEQVNHAEVNDYGNYTYEDFKQEFELGRFLADGTKQEIQNLLSCSNTQCKYNIHGKCWNSNNSYHCKFKPNN